MAGRRPAPPVPNGAPPPPPQVWKLLIQLWSWAVASHFGQPAPHVDTHLVGGDDPLPTPGTPTSVDIESTASAGSGPAFAYDDHKHNLDSSVTNDIETAELLAWIL